jgi:hypothetical protein
MEGGKAKCRVFATAITAVPVRQSHAGPSCGHYEESKGLCKLKTTREFFQICLAAFSAVHK